MCLSSYSGSVSDLCGNAGLILTLVRKGITDKDHPENEELRGRKRKAGEDGPLNKSRKRSRSISSNSSTSVSTISTNLSHSPTPSLERARLPGNWTSTRDAELGKRRRRAASSSISYSTEASSRRPRNVRPRDNSRNTRRRRYSTSSDSYGRKRHVHKNLIDDQPDHDRRSSRVSRSSSISDATVSSVDNRHRYQPKNGQTNTRGRLSSTSSDSQTRDKKFSKKRSHQITETHGESRDVSEIVRNRRSVTPGARLPQDAKLLDSPRGRAPPIPYGNDRYRSSFRGPGRSDSRPMMFAQSPRPPRNERSLSPFSKRLALTQAMNMGR